MLIAIRFGVALAVLSAIGASAAQAQTGSEWLLNRMGNALRPEVTWAEVRPLMMAAFYQSNPGERGVTAEGVDNLRRIIMAQRRSQAATCRTPRARATAVARPRP